MAEGRVHKDKIISSVRWTGFSQIASQPIRILISIILARLLAPEDFGLMAMAMVITGFIMIVQYLGTAGAIIQKKDLTAELTNSLFLLNCAFGALLALGMVALGPTLARVYNRAEVGPIIQVLAAAFVIRSAGAVPGAILNRDLRFDRIAQIDVISMISCGVAAMIAAALGARVWALVVSELTEATVSTTLVWITLRWRPRFTFVWSQVRSVLGFCLGLTGTSFVTYAVSTSDRFVIGKWLGATWLGYYTMAFRFTLYPLSALTPALTRVLYPVYSRVQEDDGELRRIFLRASAGIAFFMCPLAAGVLVLSKPLVITLFGDKWLPSVAPMMALAIVALLQAVSQPTGGVYLAKGRSDWQFWLNLVSGALTILSFFGGLKWGLPGMMWAYAIVTLPLAYVKIAVLKPLIRITIRDIVTVLRSYVLVSGLMGVAIWMLRRLLESFGFPTPAVLIICVIVGCSLYVMAMYVVRPSGLIDSFELLPVGKIPLLNRLMPADLRKTR